MTTDTILRTCLGACLVACLVVLTGCAGSARAKKENTAATIDYNLPMSQVKIGMDLVITKCTNPVKFKGAIILTPSAVPSQFPQHHFRLSGAALTSFREKRDLAIETYPTGAIKSVNGASSDRSSAIFINTLKIVATVGGMGWLNVRSSVCTPEVDGALSEVNQLRGHIKPLRESLIGGTATSIPDTQKQIDVLAQQIASIQAEHLTIKLEKTLKFADQATSGTLAWSGDDLKQHFMNTDGPITDLNLEWHVTPTTEGCGLNCAVEAPSAKVVCLTCEQTVVFREPRAALVTVKMTKQDSVPLAKLEFPMAQWGAITYFPLKTRFGESKSLKLSLDEFGRRSSFTWASAARGEEITSAAGGMLDSVAATSAARASRDTNAMKAEIEELETQKKWNALKRCEAIIQAGGAVCPE